MSIKVSNKKKSSFVGPLVNFSFASLDTVGVVYVCDTVVEEYCKVQPFGLHQTLVAVLTTQ